MAILNEFHGYKAFYHTNEGAYGNTEEKGLFNRYGERFKEGQTNGPGVFINHCGITCESRYFFCDNLIDPLWEISYDERIVAEVTGFIVTKIDDSGLCTARSVRVDKVLSREDIINYVLNIKDDINRVISFLKIYKLNDEEIDTFNEKFKDNEEVLNAIELYQKQSGKRFKKEFKSNEQIISI